MAVRPSRKPRLKLKPLVKSPNLIIQVLKSVNLQPYRRWQAKQSKRQTSIFISSDPAKSSKPNLAKYELTTKLRDGFLNGQSITITIPLSGLLIPKEAVKDGAVFKIVNKRAIRTKVTYVAKDDMYEVSDGLSSGDRILQKPDKTIKDGAKVNVDD